MNTITAKNYCPDCGPVGVVHWSERLSARLDPVMNALTLPMREIAILIRPAIHKLRLGNTAPFFYNILATLRLGTINDAPDEKNLDRARVLWEEADRRGIVMKEFRPFGLPREIFWASFAGETQSFDGLPRPYSANERSLNWMDDKGTILKKFRAAGVPVPRGGICKTFAQAEATFHAIGGNVIVKPNLGSRSRHTYVGIADLAALRHAFIKAKELTPYPVVEEELPGFVFRITLIDGKVAGAMRREPPHVIGDGKHTVRELVARENKNPLRHGSIFHELPTDDGTEAGKVAVATLAEQSLSFDAIAPTGKMIVLNPKVSRTFGASNSELDDKEVHPDNHKLFLKIAQVLDDPLVGVDFMIEDMAKSWREQKCGIIECNSLPFIDLHLYPLTGTPKNVAADVWDMCIPASHGAIARSSSRDPVT